MQQPGIAQEETVVGADVLMKMEKMEQIDLVREFCAHVSSNNYLIVIDDLSTIDEWHCIKTYFPDKKNRSRIVVATQKIEIAWLATPNAWRPRCAGVNSMGGPPPPNPPNNFQPS